MSARLYAAILAIALEYLKFSVWLSIELLKLVIWIVTHAIKVGIAILTTLGKSAHRPSNAMSMVAFTTLTGANAYGPNVIHEGLRMLSKPLFLLITPRDGFVYNFILEIDWLFGILIATVLIFSLARLIAFLHKGNGVGEAIKKISPR